MKTKLPAIPTVCVVATGGTIANTASGLVAIDDVLRTLPQATEIAKLEATEVCRVRSAQMTDTHWLEIGRVVDAATARDDVDAVLVTHGTFTHEETAYFLHLTVPTTKPIVVVSAQRKRDEVGTDGDRNFLDALRVAVSPEAHGLGVLSVLNQAVHSARDVVKTSPRPDGFRSRAHAPLGYVDSDRVVFYRGPTRLHTHRSEFSIRSLGQLPRVDVVYAYPGADGLTVTALVDAAHPAGLVLAGYAFSGMPAIGQDEALSAAVAHGIAVVLTSRGLEGRVPHPEPDSRTHGKGFVHGDDLPPHKARILLMLGLTRSYGAGELQRVFDQY